MASLSVWGAGRCGNRLPLTEDNEISTPPCLVKSGEGRGRVFWVIRVSDSPLSNWKLIDRNASYVGVISRTQRLWLLWPVFCFLQYFGGKLRKYVLEWLKVLGQILDIFFSGVVGSSKIQIIVHQFELSWWRFINNLGLWPLSWWCTMFYGHFTPFNFQSFKRRNSRKRGLGHSNHSLSSGCYTHILSETVPMHCLHWLLVAVIAATRYQLFDDEQQVNTWRSEPSGAVLN